MPTGSESRRPSRGESLDGPSLDLERFEWTAPDRLELAGSFTGIAELPPAEPVLSLQGRDGEHRLPAVPNGAGPPTDGAPWTAAFAWTEPPVAFDRARLELGATLAVELPAPGEAHPGHPLQVLGAQEPIGDPNRPEAAAASVMRQASDADGAAGRLRLEAQLLDALQELEEARVATRRLQEELDRASADLAASREREAAAAVRYREGLATVRVSAEEAIGAAELARSRIEQDARAETAALQERVRELEPAAAELEATRSQLAEARTALAEARSGAQILLDGLAHAAEPPAGGR